MHQHYTIANVVFANFANAKADRTVKATFLYEAIAV